MKHDKNKNCSISHRNVTIDYMSAVWECVDVCTKPFQSMQTAKLMQHCHDNDHQILLTTEKINYMHVQVATFGCADYKVGL